MKIKKKSRKSWKNPWKMLKNVNIYDDHDFVCRGFFIQCRSGSRPNVREKFWPFVIDNHALPCIRPEIISTAASYTYLSGPGVRWGSHLGHKNQLFHYHQFTIRPVKKEKEKKKKKERCRQRRTKLRWKENWKWEVRDIVSSSKWGCSLGLIQRLNKLSSLNCLII